MSGPPTGFTTPKTDWVAQDALDTTSYNRIEGNAQATELGERTLDQALASPTNIGTLRQIISWFAGRINAITGKTNWYDAPDTTLAAAKMHMDATAAHSATAAATADRIVLRDAAGRAQVAAPSAAADIARKDTVDTVQTNLTTHAGVTTGVHGVGVSTVESIAGAQNKVDTHNAVTNPHAAVSAATADRIVLRDASGRAAFVDGAAAGDAATKGQIDTHAALTVAGTHGAVSAATANKILIRDASGRAQVAAPSAAADIARKDTVDTVQTNLTTHAANYILQVPYGITTGSANTYAVTLTPALTTYADGVAVAVKINIDNTGASTINVNSLGAKTIKKPNGNDVATGNLKTGSIYSLRYNGTNFILQGSDAAGDATTGDVLSGKTFSNDYDTDLTGTMANKTGHVTAQSNSYTGTTLRFRPVSGHYPGDVGNSVQMADASFIAGNIRKGVTLFGLAGNLSPVGTIYDLGSELLSPFSAGYSGGTGVRSKEADHLYLEASADSDYSYAFDYQSLDVTIPARIYIDWENIGGATNNYSGLMYHTSRTADYTTFSHARHTQSGPFARKTDYLDVSVRSGVFFLKVHACGMSGGLSKLRIYRIWFTY